MIQNIFCFQQVGEVRDVGSHKHNTIITPPTGSSASLTSDLVVVLKTLPTSIFNIYSLAFSIKHMCF
jgi:predicted RNA methylase